MNKVALNELSARQKQDLYKKEFSSTLGVFQEIFGEGQESKVFFFEPEAQKLRKEILRILKEKKAINEDVPLEEIHRFIGPELRAYNFDDGVNGISKLLYDTDDQFYGAYLAIIQRIKKLLPQRPFYFQKTPTVRIHCPDAKNSHHYPRYHTDVNYGHPPQEINFWLPLTSMRYGPHGFRLMGLKETRKTLDQFNYDFDKFVAQAINCKAFTEQLHAHSHEAGVDFGQMLAFDARLLHTGMPMATHSRASLDIRIIFLDKYEAMDVQYQGLGRQKIHYAPGIAYHSLTSADI